MPISTRRLPPWLGRTARAVHQHVVRSYAVFFVRNLPRALRPRTLADHVGRPAPHVRAQGHARQRRAFSSKSSCAAPTARWPCLDVRGRSPRADVAPPPPANLAEMARIAENLGAETDIVRVDLYDLGDRVVFSELTHTPLAANRSADRALDRWTGTLWARGR